MSYICAMSGEAGKGDSPRNCFSQQFRDNYDMWKSAEAELKRVKELEKEFKKTIKTYFIEDETQSQKCVCTHGKPKCDNKCAK